MLALRPLTEAQQQRAMKLQLRQFPLGLQISEHLASLSSIRRAHDELYAEVFSADERRRIERFDLGSGDRQRLDGVVGPIEPLAVNYGPDGLRAACAIARPALMESEYLRDLDVAISDEVLAAIDEIGRAHV